MRIPRDADYRINIHIILVNDVSARLTFSAVLRSRLRDTLATYYYQVIKPEGLPISRILSGTLCPGSRVDRSSRESAFNRRRESRQCVPCRLIGSYLERAKFRVKSGSFTPRAAFVNDRK